MCAKRYKWVKQGENPKITITPMHQNLVPNNNDAQNTTKYGFLLRPDAQIVALRARCVRTVLKAPPLISRRHPLVHRFNVSECCENEQSHPQGHVKG